MEEAALLEPLSVGVHACKRGHVSVGSKVLILGCGPIGLVTVLTAKAMGAQKIIVTGIRFTLVIKTGFCKGKNNYVISDLVSNRLQMAKKFGADCCIQVKKEDDETKTISCIQDNLNDLPDVTIDCSGFESTVKLGLKVNALLIVDKFIFTDLTDVVSYIVTGD